VVLNRRIDAHGLGFHSIGQTAQPQSSFIRRILVPVDAVHTSLIDLAPVLSMACRFGARVTLLHCYTVPPSFDFAIGRPGIRDLSLHRAAVLSRFHKLAAEVRQVFPNCSFRFVRGFPVTQILRKSERMRADLIAIPLPLGLISWCCLPEELLSELVRRANCPVLCVPANQGPVLTTIPHDQDSPEKLGERVRPRQPKPTF
jgi:nucleotide-binding universal stress UspA family protein